MAVDALTDTERHWTAEEYRQLDDDRRYELYRGKLVLAPAPTTAHQELITVLGAMLTLYAREHQLGNCLQTPFDVYASDDTVVQPDFCFVSADRVDDVLEAHGATGPPDFVIEVLSPSTARRDRGIKREIYAEFGVKWLVLIDTAERTVEAFELDERGRYFVAATFTDEDTATFDAFPGFEVDLAEIWPAER